MTSFKVSIKTRQDLLEIGTYTQERWGIKQRNRYLDELNHCFQSLADNPGLGHSCGDIRPDYFSFSIGKHFIFYKKHQYGIQIVRVLHQKMHHKKHL